MFPWRRSGVRACLNASSRRGAPWSCSRMVRMLLRWSLSPIWSDRSLDRLRAERFSVIEEIHARNRISIPTKPTRTSLTRSRRCVPRSEPARRAYANVIRAVLDTNTLVSAILVPGGLAGSHSPGSIRERLFCFASDAIISEVVRTLSRERILRKYQLDPLTVARVTAFLSSDPVHVPLTVTVHGDATHPEDDLILATALSAHATPRDW